MKQISVLSSQEREDRFQLSTYGKLPVVVDRGEGCYIFDSEGNRFLDLYGGHAVTATGHCHPIVVEAISRQTQQLIFYSNATYNSTRARAVERLISTCGGYHQVFLANSGAEANENAIKLARAITGRKEVISVEGSFHGRTYGSLSATGVQKYRDYLNTPVPFHRIEPFSRVFDAISEETAAVLLEPIQSMGGVVELDVESIRRIAARCRERGALLIFDEIQTGVGRCGTFLYSEQVGVTPDLTTLAKGIASGYPAGLLLLTEEVASHVQLGDLGSTFGGNPVACAAIEATLRVIEEENLLENVRRICRELRSSLEAHRAVEEVRGRGFLVGLRFAGKKAKEVQTFLFENRILSGSSNDPDILRLMPALTLGEEEVGFFLEVLDRL